MTGDGMGVPRTSHTSYSSCGSLAFQLFFVSFCSRARAVRVSSNGLVSRQSGGTTHLSAYKALASG